MTTALGTRGPFPALVDPELLVVGPDHADWALEPTGVPVAGEP